MGPFHLNLAFDPIYRCPSATERLGASTEWLRRSVRDGEGSASTSGENAARWYSAAARAVSGVLGYSVAKAAIESFTRWMAVDMARRCGKDIRVNAIAPGFFVSTQNRSVLINPDGSLTDRARLITQGTPMGRFGDPEELQGTVLWLCGDASSFVTGAVIPVDGGFSAYSGV